MKLFSLFVYILNILIYIKQKIKNLIRVILFFFFAECFTSSNSSSGQINKGNILCSSCQDGNNVSTSRSSTPSIVKVPKLIKV